MSHITYDLIIRNGSIVTDEGIMKGDILVHDQKIVEIGDSAGSGKVAKLEVDATDLHIMPGLIDTHVHFNEPGRTEWEGLSTGSQSLAAGGVTTFFDMPLNSSPPTTTVNGFELKKHTAEQKSVVDFGLWGGLVPGNFGSLEDLKRAGVIGFKGFMSNSGIDEFLYVDDATLFQGMQKIAELGSIVALHAESDVITSSLAASYKKKGKVSIRDYVASRPVLSEIEAVGRAAAYAGVTGCKLHIVHASSGEVVKHISRAKQNGIDITVETCPHYLAFTVDDFEQLGGLAKCAPPLRGKEHVESLWEALATGEIDIIGSDHSPAPASMKVMKDDDIFGVWGGISGAQSTLNVMLEEGYWRRGIPLETIVRVTSANPAKRFGIYPQKGALAVGSDADLVLVDLHASFRLEKSHLYYRHAHSPYVGKTFRGKVECTFLRGSMVYQKGEMMNSANPGRMV
jgi:allantoinase